MHNFISYLTSKFIPQAAVVLLVGTTLTTGGLAGARLLKATELQATPEVAEVKGLAEIENDSEAPSAPRPTIAGPTGPSVQNNPQRATGSVGIRSLPTPTSVVFPVAQKNSSVPSSTAQPGQTGCIVTLFGKQYDVTPLRATHPGGDIFNCGTDMTASYQGKHGTDVSRMQPYLVQNTSGGTGATTTTNSSATGTSSQTGTSQVGEAQNRSEDESQNETEDEEESEAEKQRYEENREAAKQAAEKERENASN